MAIYSLATASAREAPSGVRHFPFARLAGSHLRPQLKVKAKVKVGLELELVLPLLLVLVHLANFGAAPPIPRAAKSGPILEHNLTFKDKWPQFLAGNSHPSQPARARPLVIGVCRWC